MVNFTKPRRRLAVKRAVGRIVALGVLLVGLASAAHAGSCRVFLNQPLIDYGQLRAETMGKRMLRLSVVCTESSTIALRFQGHAADGQSFRFGQQGSFRLLLQQPQLDGKPVELAQLLDHANRSGQLLPSQSVVVIVGGVPALGRTFSAQVQVDTWLPSAATAVRDKTTLEGSGRFELVPAG